MAFSQKREESPMYEQPIFTLPTEELKRIVGNDFEKEYYGAIRKNPEVVNYQGVYFQGELYYMGRIGAIKICETPYRHIRIFPEQFAEFAKKKKALDELNSRRDFAIEQELKQASLPDSSEIKAEDIPW